jgi:hypothetical protein
VSSMESEMVDSAPISHLLIVDDSIFFARSDSRSVESLNSTLKTYCEGSGQKINLDKSSVFFGNHCDDVVKIGLKGCWVFRVRS